MRNIDIDYIFDCTVTGLVIIFLTTIVILFAVITYNTITTHHYTKCEDGKVWSKHGEEQFWTDTEKKCNQ